jgi:ATP-dependent Lhr-like helicase
VETWRTCLEDEFDLASLKLLLGELEEGAVRVSECRTSAPSPFAGNLIWKQTNRLMYEDDVPEGERAGLRGDLLRELVFSSELRPRIPAAVLDRFQSKLRRTWPGYSPQTAGELVEWVKERLVIPMGEWQELLGAIDHDAPSAHDADPAGPGHAAELVAAASDRIFQIDLACAGAGDASAPAVIALETLPRLLTALGLDRQETERPRLTSLATPGSPSRQHLGDVWARLEGALAAPTGAADGEDALTAFVAEWLRFYGPVPQELLADALGLDGDRVLDLLETLTASETLVIDRFRAGDDAALELCDAENLERLLRLMRAAARPVFEALPLERLPQFLASWQGLATPADGVEGLQAALERLFGYSAPASLWETDLLPARLEPYYPSWLDSLLQESELVWRGCGRERLTFAFPDDVELLRLGGDEDREAAGEPDPRALFPDPRGRFTLEDLARHTDLPSAELSGHLWRLAWDGRVTNTAFAAVRQGILSRFRPTTAAEDRWVPERRQQARRAARRHRFDRWRGSRPFAGDWYRLDVAEGEPEVRDALDEEELNKDRARLLLHRYGVLFRELLERELPALRWGRLFRTLRLMELSGEVLAGQFFDDVLGLQFASPAAFRRLEEGLPDDAIVWMSAADPASPAGLGLEAIQGRYPSRLPSNHLVFHGPRLVVTSARHGAELEIHVPADHPLLGDYLGVLKHLLTRQFDPRRGLAIETVNGEPAAGSGFAARLVALFEATREAGALKLRRSYRVG